MEAVLVVLAPVTLDGHTALDVLAKSLRFVYLLAMWRTTNLGFEYVEKLVAKVLLV